jgi:hypothetical protein
MVRMRTLGLRIRFRHIRSCLGLTVKVRSVAVIHIARTIYPYQTRAASCRLGPGRGLRRRGSLGTRRRRWSNYSRSRCWGRGSRLRWSRRGGSSSSRRCIPLLHPLVSTARPLFARSGRVGSILANPGRARRRRRLTYRNLRRQKSSHYRQQMKRSLHKDLSLKIRFC